MTDPKSQRDRDAREARRWELLRNLEQDPDDPSEILAELQKLNEADSEYVGRLMNEVEVDHALRRGQVDWQYDEMRATLSDALPEDHPVRRLLERLITTRQRGEALTNEDVDALRAIGVDEASLTAIRELDRERDELDDQRRRLDGDV